MNEAELMKIPLRTEDEIIESWTNQKDDCLVSVRCATFNHVSFIEATIKSFLMQETNFPFEIWIHDDASTDGTKTIVEEYQIRYPKIIKAILQTQNQYSKGRRAGQILKDKLAGKYVAVCEGDDYWCDPLKLQKQVDYLEAHPEVVISGHDAFIIDDGGTRIKDSKLPDIHKKDYSGQELQNGKAWILTMSWVYRNLKLEFAPERLMVKNGDTFFVSILGEFGGSHYHNDIYPAAYRVHDGGIWSRVPADIKSDDSINSKFWMYRYYKRKGRSDIASSYKKAVFFELSKDISITFISKCFFLNIIYSRRLENIVTLFLGKEVVHKIKLRLRR